MSPDEYLKRCLDSANWFRKSRSLRENALTLWRQASNRIDTIMLTQSKTATAGEIYSAVDSSLIAKMLYGLAIETALKGRLIERFPERVRLVTEVDGSGNLSKVELRRNEKAAWKTHNLESLADAAEAIAKGGDSELRKVLRYFSECVEWMARYPVPLEVETGKERHGHLVDPRQVRRVEEFLDRIHSDSATNITQLDALQHVQFRPTGE